MDGPTDVSSKPSVKFPYSPHVLGSAAAAITVRAIPLTVVVMVFIAVAATGENSSNDGSDDSGVWRTDRVVDGGGPMASEPLTVG